MVKDTKCHYHGSPLPDNYDLALRRLNGLLNTVVQDQVSKGIVEAMAEPKQNNVRQIRYLPHHTVLRDDKAF